jgi:hypothetical protein
MVFRLPPSAGKPVYAVIAVLLVVFDAVTGIDILKGKTDAAEGLVMLLGSLIILFLLYRKLKVASKE